MANQELVRVMDFILNRCNERDIEAVAAAVVRRRRDLELFGGSANLPDPHSFAQQISGQINIGSTIEGLKDTVRDMAIRMIRQEAPELSDEQVAALTREWIPQAGPAAGSAEGIPEDVLKSMIDQFISFSTGTMDPQEDKNLREEMGAWPDRYWKAFPQVVKLLIKDYLKGAISEQECYAKIGTAIGFRAG